MPRSRIAATLAGISIGNVTSQNMRQREAPSTRAASKGSTGSVRRPA